MLAKRLLRPVGTAVVRGLAPALALGLVACSPADDPPGGGDAARVPDAEFVGGAACAACHAEEAGALSGSHHDLAMQAAGPASVLGDFADAEFRYAGVTTRFYRRGSRYFVSTDDARGEIAEFGIAYTFGADPLQQYLIALPDGSLHALGIAWDARPADAGGQRWMHLYADEAVDFQDPLHWTGTYQRWDTMCADCHSTDVVKSYDVAADRFATTWSSVDVDCEACHGPGSNHAADPGLAMPAALDGSRAWVFTEGRSIASRVPPAPGAGSREVETCAPCHSRRSQLNEAHAPGDPLLDGFRPALLDAGLYHADGQILDEVYVYGSFLQSAMARAGVTCSDCHDPHTARLRAEGNALCAQCHLPSVYDATEHHHHVQGTAGAECTACHMRSVTYMQIDPRRDHSFRVPRPDLSAALESPDACADCHAGESNAWAAARVAEWFPGGRASQGHYGIALAAGRGWAAEARVRLLALIADRTQPGIARATALGLLAERMAPDDVAAVEGALDDEDELVVLAAIDAVASLPADRRADLIQRFLDHERLALRIAAARALLPARALLSARRQSDLDAAIAEYLGVQAFNSDRAEGLLNTAGVAADQGRYDAAEAIYLQGIERHPEFGALYVNLSDLYRLLGRNQRSVEVLRQGLEASGEDPAVRFALALALVRTGEAGEAMPHFAAVAAAAPRQPYYGYVYAIALNDAGESAAALARLIEGSQAFPGYAENLFALATLMRDAGDREAAERYATRLAELLPGDPGAVSLLRELGQRL